MTTTRSELKPRSASRSDRERFGDVLALQRAAYVRDGGPSLTKRRSDLKKFKAALLGRPSTVDDPQTIRSGTTVAAIVPGAPQNRPFRANGSQIARSEKLKRRKDLRRNSKMSETRVSV